MLYTVCSAKVLNARSTPAFTAGTSPPSFVWLGFGMWLRPRYWQYMLMGATSVKQEARARRCCMLHVGQGCLLLAAGLPAPFSNRHQTLMKHLRLMHAGKCGHSHVLGLHNTGSTGNIQSRRLLMFFHQVLQCIIISWPQYVQPSPMAVLGLQECTIPEWLADRPARPLPDCLSPWLTDRLPG
jgi:hypothetical protein